jgi:flagellar motor switch protein FliM
MSLCIPYTAIEPIMAQLTAQTWFNYQKKGANDVAQKRLNQNLASAPVEMRTVLARTTLKLSDLMSLAIGDVITTDKPTDEPVTIEIEGRPKFFGSIGKFRGNRAIRITKLVRAAPATPQADAASAKATGRR